MSNSGKRYAKDHEWVEVGGDIATVGISDYAQKALGDVVYVELPEKGAKVAKGDEVAVVESVKAASEVYAPVGGEVVETNGGLEDEPSLVNSNAEGDGWFLKLRLDDAAELDELMNGDDYQRYVEGLD